MASRASAHRRLHHWAATRVYRPGRFRRPYTWIGDTRIAVGALPLPGGLEIAQADGVTHVVNCRAASQTRISGELALERFVFGPDAVICAPMWDNGRPQDPAVFGPAARFAARALDDPSAGVLIHCQQGRRRSVLVAYATLRLRGLQPGEAEELLISHRSEGELAPAYRTSVEEWLAAGDT